MIHGVQPVYWLLMVSLCSSQWPIDQWLSASPYLAICEVLVRDVGGWAINQRSTSHIGSKLDVTFQCKWSVDAFIDIQEVEGAARFFVLYYVDGMRVCYLVLTSDYGWMIHVFGISWLFPEEFVILRLDKRVCWLTIRNWMQRNSSS